MKGKISKVPALEQRLAIRHTLQPLDVTETGEMINHRLRIADTWASTASSPQTRFMRFTAHRWHASLDLQVADNAFARRMAQKAQNVDGFLMHGIVNEQTGRERAA